MWAERRAKTRVAGTSRGAQRLAPVRGKVTTGPAPPRRTLAPATELPTYTAEPTFMGMPDTLTPLYWTADMARRLPADGNRYEVVGRLHVALAKYLETHRAGVVLTSPADLSWGEDVLVQPDVFVVPVEQARTLEWSAVRDLLLVVEVLSPSTPRHDRFTKRRRYQEARVPLYWIVDGEARQVEVWIPEDVFPRIERDRLIWQPEGFGAPFTLPLQELFRPV